MDLYRPWSSIQPQCQGPDGPCHLPVTVTLSEISCQHFVPWQTAPALPHFLLPPSGLCSISLSLSLSFFLVITSLMWTFLDINAYHNAANTCKYKSFFFVEMLALKEGKTNTRSLPYKHKRNIHGIQVNKEALTCLINRDQDCVLRELQLWVADSFKKMSRLITAWVHWSGIRVVDAFEWAGTDFSGFTGRGHGFRSNIPFTQRRIENKSNVGAWRVKGPHEMWAKGEK